MNSAQRAFLYRRAAREERGAERGRTGERSRRHGGLRLALSGVCGRGWGKKEGRQSRDASGKAKRRLPFTPGFLLHSNEQGREASSIKNSARRATDSPPECAREQTTARRANPKGRVGKLALWGGCLKSGASSYLRPRLGSSGLGLTLTSPRPARLA